MDEVAGGDGRLVRLSSGTQVVLRPIGPGDSDALAKGYQELSVAAAYQRLHGSVAKLSAAQLAYLTEVDHHDHEAIIAYDPTNGHGLGEARYIRSRTDPAFAEIAVAVLDDWHGLELGHHLLEAVRYRAREEAITCLTAEVLSANAPMLALLRALGEVHLERKTAVTVAHLPI